MTAARDDNLPKRIKQLPAWDVFVIAASIVIVPLTLALLIIDKWPYIRPHPINLLCPANLATEYVPVSDVWICVDDSAR